MNLITRYRLPETQDDPQRTFDTLGQLIDHVLKTEERDETGSVDILAGLGDRPNGRLKYILRDDLLVVHVERDEPSLI